MATRRITLRQSLHISPIEETASHTTAPPRVTALSEQVA